MQLIEVAVVAAMRDAGVKLPPIRQARRYLAQALNCEYPFATYRFRTDGKSVLMDLDQVEPIRGKGKLIVADKEGQLAWTEILLGRFSEFEYVDDLVLRWHPAGTHKPVVIDPQVAFGAPTIRGVPTWALKGRHEAGETPMEIADDFVLDLGEVVEGLRFEGIEIEPSTAH